MPIGVCITKLLFASAKHFHTSWTAVWFGVVTCVRVRTFGGLENKLTSGNCPDAQFLVCLTFELHMFTAVESTMYCRLDDADLWLSNFEEFIELINNLPCALKGAN